MGEVRCETANYTRPGPRTLSAFRLGSVYRAPPTWDIRGARRGCTTTDAAAPWRGTNTAAAAQTSPLRGEAQRERARPTRTITMPRPRPRVCDDTTHTRRRRVASSTWGDIAPAARAARHYVTRRQPTHPPSLEPLQGHQGYWIASAPGVSRLPCRVTSTCTTYHSCTLACRSLLIRL